MTHLIRLIFFIKKIKLQVYNIFRINFSEMSLCYMKFYLKELEWSQRKCLYIQLAKVALENIDNRNQGTDF